MDKEKKLSFLVPLIAILLSLAAGAVLMLLLGKNPLQGYLSLLQGSGILPKANYTGGKGMLSDFMSFLDLLTPMIFDANRGMNTALNNRIDIDQAMLAPTGSCITANRIHARATLITPKKHVAMATSLNLECTRNTQFRMCMAHTAILAGTIILAMIVMYS